MATVVFLRGVNVGGNKRFSPAALAREMAALDVVNVGAAGTFVVRKAVAESALRAELARRLSFAAEMMCCRGQALLELEAANPFANTPSGKDFARYVTILGKPPSVLPPLPLSDPVGARWQVKIIGVTGRFVLSLHRRGEARLIYPNEVVDREFKTSATTRNWNTILTTCKILERR